MTHAGPAQHVRSNKDLRAEGGAREGGDGAKGRRQSLVEEGSRHPRQVGSTESETPHRHTLACSMEEGKPSDSDVVTLWEEADTKLNDRLSTTSGKRRVGQFKVSTVSRHLNARRSVDEITDL
eukprot:TRINITY_DN2116_c0_g2_i5.p1 TRINITY_DN2116_c0_g2~~TRINITY_DN2116_c0_g2_i5.p1  ORF type:complete len:123 (+),score=16.95 TRINITY_DN2116_c0_g2_i5:22-390(+)